MKIYLKENCRCQQFVSPYAIATNQFSKINGQLLRKLIFYQVRVQYKFRNVIQLKEKTITSGDIRNASNASSYQIPGLQIES
jgi:hypothetical protein